MKAYESDGAACFAWNTAELAKAAPGWLPPQELRDKPVLRTITNPFTGRTETRPSLLSTDSESPAPKGAPRVLDLSDYPFCSILGLQPWDMAPLAQLLLGCSDWEAYERWTLYLNGPDDASDILVRFCPLTRQALAALPEHRWEPLAEQWAAKGDISPEDAEQVLANLVPFMRSADSDGRTPYLWTSR